MFGVNTYAYIIVMRVAYRQEIRFVTSIKIVFYTTIIVQYFVRGHFVVNPRDIFSCGAIFKDCETRPPVCRRKTPK